MKCIIQHYKKGVLVGGVVSIYTPQIVQKHYDWWGKENVKVWLEMDALDEGIKENIEFAEERMSVCCDDYDREYIQGFKDALEGALTYMRYTP